MPVSAAPSDARVVTEIPRVARERLGVLHFTLARGGGRPVTPDRAALAEWRDMSGLGTTTTTEPVPDRAYWVPRPQRIVVPANLPDTDTCVRDTVAGRGAAYALPGAEPVAQIGELAALSGRCAGRSRRRSGASRVRGEGMVGFAGLDDSRPGRFLPVHRIQVASHHGFVAEGFRPAGLRARVATGRTRHVRMHQRRPPLTCEPPLSAEVAQRRGLRTGWTTGTCASAAAKAGAIGLLSGTPPTEVEVGLPRGERVTFPVEVGVAHRAAGRGRRGDPHQGRPRPVHGGPGHQPRAPAHDPGRPDRGDRSAGGGDALGPGRGGHGRAERSEQAAQALFRDLDPVCVVELGDFCGIALRRAAGAGMEEVVFVGMAGKIAKLAAGVMMTHFRRSEVDTEILAQVTGAPEPVPRETRATATARHFCEVCVATGCLAPLTELCRRAASACLAHTGGRLVVDVVMVDYEGRAVLALSPGGDEAGPKGLNEGREGTVSQ